MSAVPHHVRIMEYVSICRGIFFAIVLMDFPAICAKVVRLKVSCMFNHLIFDSGSDVFEIVVGFLI